MKELNFVNPQITELNLEKSKFTVFSYKEAVGHNSSNDDSQIGEFSSYICAPEITAFKTTTLPKSVIVSGVIHQPNQEVNRKFCRFFIDDPVLIANLAAAYKSKSKSDMRWALIDISKSLKTEISNQSKCVTLAGTVNSVEFFGDKIDITTSSYLYKYRHTMNFFYDVDGKTAFSVLNPTVDILDKVSKNDIGMADLLLNSSYWNVFTNKISNSPCVYQMYL
jgi:hypothetical protein